MNTHTRKFPPLLWPGLAALAVGLAWLRRRRAARARDWQAGMTGPAPLTALVTGASSGIGAAYARRLAELGYNLVLVARREQRLNEMAARLRLQHAVQVEVLAADLSTPEGVERVERRAAAGEFDFLVNNAGFAVFADFVERPIEEHLGLLRCHVEASLRLCRAVLPGMITRNRGAIVNLASIGAFVPKPKDAGYIAAKAYLTSFSQSLQMELAGTQVRVQALCPGFTRTEFHDHPQYAAYRIKQSIPAWLWMEPEALVAGSLRGLAEAQVVCVPGIQNQVIVQAGRSGLTTPLLSTMRSMFSHSHVARFDPAWLEVLACPVCHRPLEWIDRGTEPVAAGTLACRECAREYPIVDGIPRFIQAQELTGLNRRFAYLYDWFSWIYRAFSTVAFAFIGTTEEQARREILDRLEPRGGRVLEVSIGPGVNLPYLIHRPDVGEILGLDISLGQLKRCHTYTAGKGWTVGLVLGNAEQLPAQDNSFDGVFHIGGINFFNDKQKAIAEMIRVARPGSRILICDETEKGAQVYERILPGFSRSFGGERKAVAPPLDLVPPEMEEVRLFDVWKGWFYCIEFRKPAA